MRLIRLCWSDQVRIAKGETYSSTLWTKMNNNNAELIRLMNQAGNEAYGMGTHWIEHRAISDSLQPPA